MSKDTDGVMLIILVMVSGLIIAAASLHKSPAPKWDAIDAFVTKVQGQDYQLEKIGSDISDICETINKARTSEGITEDVAIKVEGALYDVWAKLDNARIQGIESIGDNFGERE